MTELTWITSDAPSLTAFFGFELQPIPVIPVIGGLVALAYVTGWIRLAISGGRWSAWRGIRFFLGCVLLAATMGLAIEGYGQVMFLVFMFQQRTLMMAMPPLLLLGAPGTLLLRSTPRNLPGRMILKTAIFGLRSSPGKVIVSSLFSVPLFLALFYGLDLSNAVSLVFNQGIGVHSALELVFLFTGIVVNATLIPADLLPVPESHVVRVFSSPHSFMEAGLHAFFGVIVMMATLPLVDRFAQLPPRWGIDTMEAVLAEIQPLRWLDSGAEVAYLKVITHICVRHALVTRPPQQDPAHHHTQAPSPQVNTPNHHSTHTITTTNPETRIEHHRITEPTSNKKQNKTLDTPNKSV